MVVTATLSEALDTAITVPLRYGHTEEDEPEDTAEDGDYRTPAGIRIAAGATVGRVNVGTVVDDDAFDERFTVSLDGANLPPEVQAGSPASVKIGIRDSLQATVTLRAIDTGVAEGDEAEFILLLSQPAPAPSEGGRYGHPGPGDRNHHRTRSRRIRGRGGDHDSGPRPPPGRPRRSSRCRPTATPTRTTSGSGSIWRRTISTAG